MVDILDVKCRFSNLQKQVQYMCVHLFHTCYANAHVHVCMCACVYVCMCGHVYTCSIYYFFVCVLHVYQPIPTPPPPPPLPLPQVCMHVIQSVHTEMERMKDEWEGIVNKAPPPKPMEGAGQEGSVGKEAKSSDSYCFELLSMVARLSQSDLGCEFLSKQDKLVQDLFALLHIATVRIQLQVMQGHV